MNHLLPKRRSGFVAPTIFILLLVFLTWILAVLLPILGIELTYQYKSLLKNVFHVSSARSLFFPQFSISIQSNNIQNGIEIPALFIDSPIIYNVDPNDTKAYTEALKHGIAQASGTGLPGSGKLGYYFAHSSTAAFVTQYNAIFYLLNRLNTGDTIIVWHEGKKYPYTVYTKRIVPPNDVSFLTDRYDGDTIVLQTCWPPGTSLNRLLVFAKAAVVR